MSVKTRGEITTDIAADYLTGTAGNISAADIRKGLTNLNDSKANIIKTGLDCSANPNYPTSERGDTIPVSVAGRVGGAAGKLVKAGDLIVCLADASTGSESAVGTSFIVVEGNRNGLQVLYTAEVDLKTIADHTIDLPADLYFCPIEAFLVVTEADTVSGQPTIRFGNSSDRAALKSAAGTSGLTAVGDRHRVTSFDTNDGQTATNDISAGITVAATATTMTGRFGFIGFFLPV